MKGLWPQLRRRLAPLLKRLPLGSFGRSVSVMAGGSAAGQLILIVSSPVVTRLYTPTDFGVYAVYGATLGILGVVSALAYEYAIPLAKTEEEALNVVALSAAALVLLTLVTWIGAELEGHRLVELANVSIIEDYLWIIPLGLLGSGTYRVLNYWGIRQREYGRIATTKLYRGLGQAGTQIVLGSLQWGPLGLIAGQIVGQTTGATSLSRSLRSAWSSHRDALSLSRVLAAFRRYWKFPAFSASGALLNAGGLYIPAVLFSALYSPEVAGLFALGQRTIGLPVSLISRSVAQVYLGEATDGGSGGVDRMRQLFRRTTTRLAALAVLPAAMMLFLAPPIFAFVFGDTWREAGVYVQLLVLMFVARFVVTAASHTLRILEHQDRQFIWDVFRLLVVIASIAGPGVYGASARTAVLSYSAGMCVSYLLLYWIMAVSLRPQVVDR